MASKVKIDTERCKGCGLCVTACSRDGIVISKRSNKIGYFPAQIDNNVSCTGCAMCALLCPEAVIEIYRDIDITTIEPDRKDSSVSTKRSKKQRVKTTLSKE